MGLADTVYKQFIYVFRCAFLIYLYDSFSAD